MNIVPSKYQEAIFEHIASSKNHLVVEAAAGAAKTTTQIMGIQFIKSSSVAMVSFGKDIQLATQEKLEKLGLKQVTSRTYHSLGNANVRGSSAYKKAVLDNDKAVKYLVGKVFGHSNKEKYLAIAASKIWDMARYNLLDDFGDSSLFDVATAYDVDLYDDTNSENRTRIFEMVRLLRKEWFNLTDSIDYVDMIYLPVADNRIRIQKFDYVLADEVQDTNPAELELLLRSTGGKFVGVGDPNQAIFAFAGAGSDSMDVIVRRTNADILPLSISYRCPKAVKSLVNSRFPHIAFDVPEWALEGNVSTAKKSELTKMLSETDMVLCRVNADLVGLAFELIRSGKKASVRGRDIGRGLSKLVESQKAYDMHDLIKRLSAWKDRQIEKAALQGKTKDITSVMDKYDTIVVLSENCDTVEQLLQRINALFSDDKAGIQGSSIHKAKGLEAERVFILRPDLLPHPMAKTSVARQQEANLEYVAITRTKRDLVFVK